MPEVDIVHELGVKFGIGRGSTSVTQIEHEGNVITAAFGELTVEEEIDEETGESVVVDHTLQIELLLLGPDGDVVEDSVPLDTINIIEPPVEARYVNITQEGCAWYVSVTPERQYRRGLHSDRCSFWELRRDHMYFIVNRTLRVRKQRRREPIWFVTDEAEPESSRPMFEIRKDPISLLEFADEYFNSAPYPNLYDGYSDLMTDDDLHSVAIDEDVALLKTDLSVHPIVMYQLAPLGVVLPDLSIVIYRDSITDVHAKLLTDLGFRL